MQYRCQSPLRPITWLVILGYLNQIDLTDFWKQGRYDQHEQDSIYLYCEGFEAESLQQKIWAN